MSNKGRVTNVREPFLSRCGEPIYLQEIVLALPLVDEQPRQIIETQTGNLHVMLQEKEAPEVAFAVLARESVSS